MLTKLFSMSSRQKRLGQVFLKDNNVIQKIIQVSKITPRDKVLEIGPGKGILTEALLKTGAKITAVEKDIELVKFIKNHFKGKSNLKIIHADIRDFFENSYSQQGFNKETEYKVIGNIPYYLTSRLLRLLLEASKKPSLIILMIQKEVAERIIAQPPKMSLLSAAVQFYAKAEIICYVDKTAFHPKPKVDSAVIKITPYPSITRSKTTQQSFFRTMKAGFNQPRKLLINNLSKNLKIKKDVLQKIFLELNFPLNIRAQNLSIEEWIFLSSLLIKNIV